MIQLDQSDPSAIEPGVNDAVAALGRLDVLVNNAGWNIGVPFRDLDALTVEVWDRVNEVNVRGPFLLARAAARHLRARGAGRIVNIASVAGLRAAGSSNAYAVSKAGLIHLTPCPAVAPAPRGAAQQMWEAVRDVGGVQESGAPGFVVDPRLQAGARVVTFANGLVARELIVDVDDEGRRLAWAVVGSPRLTHHNASMQVFDDGDRRSRVVWIADLLPNEIGGTIAAMIEEGLGAMKKTLER